MTNHPKAACYACTKPAVSREHVPPRCFFPNSLASGDELGTARITVPSCHLHNGDKSQDDDFLRLVLLAGAKDPSAALDLTSRSVRGLEKKPQLMGEILAQLGAQYDNDGTFLGFKGTGMVFDRDKVYRSLVAVARGVFFYEFGRRLTKDPQLIAPSLFRVVTETAEGDREATLEILDPAMAGLPWKGAVPEVFTYRGFGTRAPDVWFGAIEMVFYQAHRVLALSGQM